MKTRFTRTALSIGLLPLLLVLLGSTRLSADGLPLTTFQLPDFVGSGSCALCHSNLVDAARNDVSMDAHWRSTMMANSGKDPLWQAKVASEVLRNPALKAVIEDKCATCHLPMARTEAVTLGSAVGVHGAGFLNPANGYHAAAKDGVSCALCHQVRSDSLGQSASFSGHYKIDTTTEPPHRLIYGPFPGPNTMQMQNNVGFTPIQGAHVKSSGLCGSCHNLRTPYVDAAGQVLGEFPEQMIYSEWEHSAYNSSGAAARSCQDCHMPPAAGGVVLSNRGGPGLNLPARSPVGQHHFVGGNLFMLDLFAANLTSLQLTASSEQLAATRERTLTQLQTRTASLQSTGLSLSADELKIGLRTNNLAGHKVPSGFPSRRTWVHLEVKDGAGNILFSSGEPLPDGRIAGNDADFSATTCEPHYDVITRPDQVQIYEAVMQDSDGAVTYTLLRGALFRKDNRLLPIGFSKETASRDVVPAGEALADANFIGGSDDLQYRINRVGRAGPFTVTARLLHQTVSYAFAADLLADAAADPVIESFATLYRNATKIPVTLAQFETTVDSSVTPGGDPPDAARLINLSSRARVGAGDAAAIAGFVIVGQESKPVLIRAVGPTLGQAPFNLPNVLPDPRLELFSGSLSLALNAGVGSAVGSVAIAEASAQVGAFPLGTSGKDAALVLTLAPGGYTAVVSSATAQAGVVLVEVYDLSAGSAGRKLLNLSTRAATGSAENTLIAGVVLSGTTSKRMLFRAVGPGLVPFGVSGVLARPTLTLFRESQVLASNTDWTTAPDSATLPLASSTVGAFAMAAGDSALILTLAPGSYTAQVSGPEGATGVALIEVYELP